MLYKIGSEGFAGNELVWNSLSFGRAKVEQGNRKRKVVFQKNSGKLGHTLGESGAARYFCSRFLRISPYFFTTD